MLNDNSFLNIPIPPLKKEIYKWRFSPEFYWQTAKVSSTCPDASVEIKKHIRKKQIWIFIKFKHISCKQVWPLNLRNNGTVFSYNQKSSGRICSSQEEWSPPQLHNSIAIRPVRDVYLCNTDELHRPPAPFPTGVTLNPEEEITLHLKPSWRLWPTPEPTRSVRANNDSTFKCQAVHLSSHRSVQQPLGPGWRRVRIQAQKPTLQLCSSRSETPPCAFTLTFTNADIRTRDTSQTPVTEG